MSTNSDNISQLRQVESEQNDQIKRNVLFDKIKIKYMKIYYFDMLAQYAGLDPYDQSCYPT